VDWRHLSTRRLNRFRVPMKAEEEPDGTWVAALAHVDVEQADRALEVAQGDYRLFHHLERQHEAGGRSGYIEIDAPLELYALVHLLRPTHVVEVGVSSGVSSAYILQAMGLLGHGTLHSVDLPKTESVEADGRRSRYPSWAIPPGRASGWAVPFPLRQRWDLRLGNKRDVLPLLAEELPTVDLFLYDVPHSDPQAFSEFRSIDPRFHRGSVALVDHGGTEETCPSLRRWARTRRGPALRRRHLGLSGFRSR
jgi:Methyltransferase domain